MEDDFDVCMLLNRFLVSFLLQLLQRKILAVV